VISVSLPHRLLVTGSRHYEDRDKVQKALWPWTVVSSALLMPLTLVHGACPFGGLDLIAAETWDSWGLPVYAVPAEHDTGSGKFLGPERNTKMVQLGGYAACLGFPLRGSRGTYDCMNKAAAAGIVTMEVK